MIALNIEVRIPRHNTTANPLIGPEPNKNKANPANNHVII